MPPTGAISRRFVRASATSAYRASPVTITLSLADLVHRGRAASTWERRLAAISVYHRAAGFEIADRARGRALRPSRAVAAHRRRAEPEDRSHRRGATGGRRRDRRRKPRRHPRPGPAVGRVRRGPLRRSELAALDARRVIRKASGSRSPSHLRLDERPARPVPCSAGSSARRSSRPRPRRLPLCRVRRPTRRLGLS